MSEVNDIRFLNKASLRKYYENSRNKIEDPLFTGFTLDIDTLHSPLFYSLAGDEYSEILRSPEGKDTSLANKIEEKLAYVNKYAITQNPDTYEINTIKAKDDIGDRKAGYGLWDKYYLDNVLYGAVDYIYMVDKVTDGAYTDDYGVTDLGNGTPTRSQYAHYNDILSSDPELNVQKQEIEGKINESVPNNNTNIFFDNDDYDIRADQQKAVNNLVAFLKENPEATVQIDGYASKDNATAEHNMNLSENRAETIKNELIRQGIDSSRITTDYHGDTVQPFDGIQNRAVACQVSGDVTQQSSLDYKIKKEESAITDKMKEDHENNLKNVYGTKPNGEPGTKDDPGEGGTYNAYKSKVNENSEYTKNTKTLEDITSDIEVKKYEVENELRSYKTDIEKNINLLQSTSDENKKDEYRNKINLIYSNFEKYVNYFSDPSTDSPYGESTYSEYYKNIDATLIIVKNTDLSTFQKEESEFQKKEDQSDIEYFRKMWAVTKTQFKSKKVNDSANKQISELKNKISEESKVIYGVHKDGRIGTKEDPAPESLYYNYNKAKEKAETDEFSQQTFKVNELKDIQENYEDIQEYQNYQSTKTTIESTLPTIDYEMSEEEKNNPTLYHDRIEKAKNTRVTYEVPQTVYDMLGFINGMNDLVYEHPYAMQTVTGLDEAYKKYFDLKDPYMGGDDNKITIECLEFLDLRISSMFNKYFNAVYDRQYRRERVPINLRRFQCSIFVHDIRNFKDSIKGTVEENAGDLSNIVKIALNSLSAIEFKFYDCEIVPEETGSIFDSVTNVAENDMKTTKFTFTYGNCVINFLPFEDLRKYILQKDVENIKPNPDYISLEERNSQKYQDNSLWNSTNLPGDTNNPDGNFRRWYDRSELGSVNNNDYRDYIRKDSYVAVDDHYKTTIVNNFAMGSVAQKNKELTEMDDALRRIVVGISASTGIPVKGVTDALNIGFIDPILNEKDLAAPVVKNLGNVTNSKIIDTDTTEYIGTVIGEEKKDSGIVTDLGNVEEDKKE